MVTPLQISLGNAGLWLAPVQRWIDAEGLETTDDLRCYFRSAVAAGVQGGPLLRLAWEHCSAVGPTDQSLMVLRARREVQVELQQLGRLLAKPPLPLVRRAGRPRRQPKVTDEDSYKAARRAAAEAAVQLSFSWAPLYGLAANSGSTPMSTLDQWRQQCIGDIAEFEERYIMHGLRTWSLWERYCAENSITPTAMEDNTLSVQVWIKSHASATGPLAAYNAMKWLRTHLKAPVILDLAPKPKRKAQKAEDKGQTQAVVAEPGMVAFLAETAHQMHLKGDWRLALVCCTHTVALGVMRMGHLERSRFLRDTPAGRWARAFRGKGRDSQGHRPAFDWFCPRVSLEANQKAPIDMLFELWDRWSRRNGAPLQYLTMDAATGLKTTGSSINCHIKELFIPVLGVEQADLVTSYSWRRVGSTLASTRKSSIEEVTLFGGWAGVFGRVDTIPLKKSMAHRYNGRKAELESINKTSHWEFFRLLVEKVRYPLKAKEVALHTITWEDLDLAAAAVNASGTVVLEEFKVVAEAAATALANEPIRDFAFGAADAVRTTRFALKSKLALQLGPKERIVTEEAATTVQEHTEIGAAAVDGYKWVTSLVGQAVHVRTSDGPPPEILCKMKKAAGSRHLMSSYAMYGNWQEALCSGKRCCGTCWRDLPLPVHAFLAREAEGLLPLSARGVMW